MPGTHGVDLPNFLRVCHGDVRDELLCLSVGGDADKQLELRVCCVQPQTGDQDGKDNRASRIDPPHELGAADGGEHTKAVDEKVVAVVFPQNSDLGVLVAQSPTV